MSLSLSLTVSLVMCKRTTQQTFLNVGSTGAALRVVYRKETEEWCIGCWLSGGLPSSCNAHFVH